MPKIEGTETGGVKDSAKDCVIGGCRMNPVYQPEGLQGGKEAN